MPRILVLEDEDLFRRMLRQMLERAGYEVAEASDGEMGLRLYRQQPADVVIADIFMPDMDGLETIRELSRDFPEAKIIAISGGGSTGHLGYLGMAEDFGAAHTLAKPFERQELLEAVKELLERG